MKRLSAVIGDQDPSLLSSRDAQPRHARVLPGADRRRHTARRRTILCNRIRKAGGACFVLKNRGVPG